MAGLDYKQLQNVNKTTEQITEQQKKKGMGISPEALDTLLNTGLQATATIVGQRAASGKSASRQQRIAACGRKPTIGIGKKFRQRKADYQKCVSNLQSGGAVSQRSGDVPPYIPPSDEGGSNTMMYVGIGVGVVVLGVVGFILYKKFGK
jgi:hypothetical protein